ncbi:MAG TPA: hypothetical protein VFQ80_15775 [Thermomicrobiales bacterium]|nr:hypothetical protein [Thermomicrobiales bacterium]
METERFDRLATSLAQSRDRRSMLRLLGIAVLGAGGVALVGDEAIAAKAKARKKGHGHRHPGGNNGGGDGGNSGDNGGDNSGGTGGGGAGGGSDPGQGTCVGGVDVCLGNGTTICTCNNGQDTGLCRSQMEGGTVCAIDITRPAQTTSDQCKTNGDCARLGFPPGSSCVVDTGPNCPLGQNSTMGTCVAPCGFVEPA